LNGEKPARIFFYKKKICLRANPEKTVWKGKNGSFVRLGKKKKKAPMAATGSGRFGMLRKGVVFVVAGGGTSRPFTKRAARKKR